MNKEIYEPTLLEIIRFNAEDIVTTSPPEYEDDETQFMPNKP